ncbi:hypothetical protein [Streptomyces cellulosae]|uniref:Uncharacterized protein n=1 Tax=Streptomyces cellulosae TaxID=1968 RepID=A0ABW7XTQ1_STRCE
MTRRNAPPTLHISFDVRGYLLIRQLHHWAALLFQRRSARPGVVPGTGRGSA